MGEEEIIFGDFSYSLHYLKMKNEIEAREFSRNNLEPEAVPVVTAEEKSLNPKGLWNGKGNNIPPVRDLELPEDTSGATTL